jgi:hypothetical protein
MGNIAMLPAWKICASNLPTRKSQIAIEYSYGFRDQYPKTWVFWVHASNAARFQQSYNEIANRLELPGREQPDVNVLRLVYAWLCNEASGRWLMILDNADDAGVLFEQESNPRPRKSVRTMGVILNLCSLSSLRIPMDRSWSSRGTIWRHLNW